MMDFYQKRLVPKVGDTSAAPMAYFENLQQLSNIIDVAVDRRERAMAETIRAGKALLKEETARLEREKEAQRKDEENLFQAQYRNEAQRAAVEAYGVSPNDIDGYKRAFRDMLGKIKVPLNQQAKFGAITEAIESQYYWTIAANRGNETRSALKSSVAQMAEDYVTNGISFMDGELADPLPPAAVENQFRDATAALFSSYGDGTPMFASEERAQIMDRWNLQVLTTSMERQISGESAAADLVRILDPNFDYTVTVPTDSEPISFQRTLLSRESQNRFNAAAAERVAQVIKNEAGIAELNHAQKIWRGEEHFLEGDAKDKGALEKLADVQVARDPITGDNLPQHMENCRKYLQRYNFIPKAYVRAIDAMALSDNPQTANMGATLLTQLVALSPKAADGFPDATLLRANMIYAQISTGATAKNARDRADRALDPRGNAGMESLRKRLRTQTEDKFYGKDVNEEIYGASGVAEYRRMVDELFLLNGGDRDSAVKTAKARMDSEYAETRIGADRGWRMPFFDAKRKKFKNTPEAVYGPNSAGIINLDLEASAPQIEKASGIPCDLDHIVLVPTPETDRAVEMGEDPTWQLLRRNDDGTSQFYTDPWGNPMTYSLSEGVQRAIYLSDLRDAEEAAGGPAAQAKEIAKAPFRMMGELGKTLLYDASWVGDQIIKAVEGLGTVAHEVIGGFSGERLERANERNRTHNESIRQFFHNLWENPGRNKRRIEGLLRSSAEAPAHPKETKKRKEWDAARRTDGK